MRCHKGATSQDDSIAKVADFAAQLFLEREFAFLLLNDLLSLGQVKGRPVLVGGESPLRNRCLRYSASNSSQQVVSGRPRMVLSLSWAAGEPLASASA